MTTITSTPHDELVNIFRAHIAMDPAAKEMTASALSRISEQLADIVGECADTVVNDFLGRANPAPKSPLKTLASELLTAAESLDSLPAALRQRRMGLIIETPLVTRMISEAAHLAELAAAVEEVQA